MVVVVCNNNNNNNCNGHRLTHTPRHIDTLSCESPHHTFTLTSIGSLCVCAPGSSSFCAMKESNICYNISFFQFLLSFHSLSHYYFNTNQLSDMLYVILLKKNAILKFAILYLIFFSFVYNILFLFLLGVIILFGY